MFRGRGKAWSSRNWREIPQEANFAAAPPPPTRTYIAYAHFSLVARKAMARKAASSRAPNSSKRGLAAPDSPPRTSDAPDSPGQAVSSSAGRASSRLRLVKRCGCSLSQMLLLLASTYVLFWHVLPYLAEATPAGIDMDQLLRDAAKVHEAQRRKEATNPSQHCPKGNPCKGMSCPGGWMTGLKPELPCECQCVRLDAKKPTRWDIENGHEEEFHRAASNNQVHAAAPGEVPAFAA